MLRQLVVLFLTLLLTGGGLAFAHYALQVEEQRAEERRNSEENVDCDDESGRDAPGERSGEEPLQPDAAGVGEEPAGEENGSRATDGAGGGSNTVEEPWEPGYVDDVEGIGNDENPASGEDKTKPAGGVGLQPAGEVPVEVATYEREVPGRSQKPGKPAFRPDDSQLPGDYRPTAIHGDPSGAVEHESARAVENLRGAKGGTLNAGAVRTAGAGHLDETLNQSRAG